MDEALYRQNQATMRLFGPSAVLTGSIGTPSRPGVVEIKANGRTLGRGPSFQAALADVTVRSTPGEKRAGKY